MNMAGVELATGVGSCSTMETKFRYRGGEKIGTGQPVPPEYWNLKKAGKKDDAQKLIGGTGYGPGKIDGVWQICEIGEKMENPDIADTYNTVLKMAKKRAYVDGILSATGASDIFTQDIEDMPNIVNGEAEESKIEQPQSTKPAVEMPKSKAENGNGEVITEPQRKRLYAIAMSAKMTQDNFKEWLLFNYGYENSRDVKKSEYEAICKAAQEYKVE
jgi:hypothetical protein